MSTLLEGTEFARDVITEIVNYIPNGHISNFSASYLVRIDVFKYITFRAFIDSQHYITLFTQLN